MKIPFGKTPLQKALERFAGGEDLETALESVGDEPVASKRDAVALVEALGRIPRVPHRVEGRYRTSPLFRLVALFQEVEDPEAAKILREQGGPELVRIFEASFPPDEDDHDDAPFLLKILVMYRVAGTESLIERAAGDPSTRDFFLWSVILSQMESDHPMAAEIIERLRDPLPEGFAGIAFLDLANQRARELNASHPFDTALGLARLESILTDPDPEHFSHAQSAAGAIPFLKTPSRKRLLDLAWSHPDFAVRAESWWSAAKLGDERGIAALAEASADARHGSRALAYLEELDRLDAAPASAMTDEHRVLAEMADWLSYPTEFGRFPDALRVLDTRELFWPPTNDRRRLWLIDFTYEACEGREKRETGVGMVGSITFALFGETTESMSPEDLYALHCVWELQTNADPRAPEDRSIEEGRKLLGF
jgi:hypothetical protein